MVNEILRDRDHAGFGDRNEYGSRMGGGGGGGGNGGGGIDVSNLFVFKTKDKVETISCNVVHFLLLNNMYTIISINGQVSTTYSS